MATRVYSTMEARQQVAATTVATWDDVRRAMTLALQEQRPCNLLLMADLYATSTLTVPTGLPSFSIDGGGKFKVNIKGKFTRWCAVNSTTNIHDVEIRLLDDAVVTQMFGVNDAVPLTLERVDVDASRGDIVDVFGLLGTYSERLLVSGCDFREVSNIFAADGAGKRWDRAAIRDSTFLVDIDYGTPTTLGRGPTDVIFRQCEFSRINSSLAVDLGIGSNQCVFQSLPGFFGLTTNSAGVFGHTFIACSIGGTPVLGGADVWFGDGQVIAPGSLVTVNDLAVVDDVTVSGNLDVSGDVEVDGNLIVNSGTTLATVTASGLANLSGGVTTTSVRANNGTVGAAAYGFSAAGNGMYLAATNDLRLAAAGSDNIRMLSTSTAVLTALTAPSLTATGTVAAQSLTASLSSTLANATATSLGVSGNATVSGTLTAGARLVCTPDSLVVSGASPVIVPSSRNMFLTLSSATGSITVQRTGYSAGEELRLVVVSSTSSTATLPDALVNGCRLSAAWTPAAFSSIEFVHTGTYWQETSRTAT